MNRIILLLLVGAGLTGCEEVFRGSLNLNTDIQIEAELSRAEQRLAKRCERRNYRSSECRRLKRKIEKSQAVISAGAHSAKLIPGRKSVKLKILNQKGRTAAELKIKVPKGVDLPRNNGSIELAASETGFPYDVKGRLNTEVSDSNTYYDSESCTWTESQYVCRRVLEPIPGCKPGDKNRRGKPKKCMRRVKKCETVYVTRHGYQEVEFFNRHTQKDIVFSMIKPETRAMIGEFDGVYNNREKIYTYRSQCR